MWLDSANSVKVILRVDSFLCVLCSPRRPLLWLPALSGYEQVCRNGQVTVGKGNGSFGAQLQTGNGAKKSTTEEVWCVEPATD